MTAKRMHEQKRKDAKGKLETNKCKCGKVEDHVHRYWRCELTKDKRPEWMQKENVAALPECLKCHAVMPTKGAEG